MQHESQRNLLKLERLTLVLMGKAFCLSYYSVQNTQGQQRGHNSSRIIISILNYFCNHAAAAAAAAKSLQSCPTLCDPIDGGPPGSPVPGILQARTLEWVAISFSNARKWKVKVKSLSRVRLFRTPWIAVHQALPSMGFSRQEYWSGVPLPSLNSSLSLIIKSNRDGVKAAELCCPSSFLKTLNHTLRLCSPFLYQPWIFIGRTDAEAETVILWSPDAKRQLLEKTLVLGKIEGKGRSG